MFEKIEDDRDVLSAEIEYSSYILRLWREAPGGTLRATLKDVSNGSQRSFTTIKPLINFLTSQTDQQGNQT